MNRCRDCAALVLLAAGLASAQWPTTDPTLAAWNGPVELDCLCSDAVPRAAYTQNVSDSGTCAEQQASGNCAQPFMLNSVKELPEGVAELGRASE